MSIGSYLHATLPEASPGPILESWRDDADVTRAVLTIWEGGSLVEMTRVEVPGPESVPGGVSADDREDGPKVRDWVRGKVTGFSVASRRRLMRLLGRLKGDALPFFVTLTISDAADHTGPAMKQYLRRFKARLARRWPGAAMIWRLECKPRLSGAKQGQIVAHYHVLLWLPVEAVGLGVQAIRAWVAENWYQSVASGDAKHRAAGTQVDCCKSWRQLRAYASKTMYFVKDGDQDVAIADVGRYWGCLNDDGLPYALAVCVELTHGQAVRLLRVLRGYIRSRFRMRGKRKPRRVDRWRHWFVEDPGQWVKRLGALV